MRRSTVRRRPTLALLALTVTAVTLTACTSDLGAVSTVPVAAPVSAPSPQQTPAQAPSPDGASEPPALEASAGPVAGSSVSARPSSGYDVKAALQVLTDGGYYVGAVDAKPGPAMRSAVMAFQKVNGLGVDGAVGPATLAAMESPKTPVLKGSGPANRVEVDLTRQVLYVVKSNAVARIMPVSSGNGATYAQKNGTKARALTPTGYFTIERRIVGERVADLGTLYDPQYFYRGWAIHGSNSVPAGPASHGCVRVTRPDAKYLLDLLSNGMTVFLYGGTHTFTAGSTAAGTDNPTGDGAAPAPSVPATPEPTTAKAASPSPARPTLPTPGSPGASTPVSPAPSASAPGPSATPSPSPLP